MAYFIKTNSYAANEWYIKLFFPYIDMTKKGDLGVSFYVTQSASEIDEYTLGFAPPIPVSGVFRFYVVPVSVTDTTLFGICTQWLGRTMWVMAYPQDPPYPLKYWQGDFPPDNPNHPAVFRLLEAQPFWHDMWVRYLYIYNHLYDRCIKANFSNDRFTLDNQVDNLSVFGFRYQTSYGPVIPTPVNFPPEDAATYYILSRYKHALSGSLTAPHLTLATVDFSSIAQQFFFREEGSPTIVTPGRPFTYRMYLRSAPTVMICFEPNGTIGTRTVAGPWETLYFEQEISPPDLGTFGRFKIMCFDHRWRLRANANGTLTLIPNTYADSTDDYFTILPVGSGIPFLPLGRPETAPETSASNESPYLEKNPAPEQAKEASDQGGGAVTSPYRWRFHTLASVLTAMLFLLSFVVIFNYL